MREECRHILNSGFIWLFLAGSLTVNLWIVWNYREQREYVEISRTLAESGTDFFTPEREEEIILAFEGAEESSPGQISVRSMVTGAGNMAEKLTAMDLAEAYVQNLKLKGAAADHAREAYRTLDLVMEENRRDGTARQLFVPCGSRFFELFSFQLPIACTVETVLAAVLLMLRCVNAPFDQRTGAVVYASKTGRKVNRAKAGAVFAVATGVAAIVWIAAYGSAALYFPLGRLWDTGLGSMMALDCFYPLITRFSMSIRTYVCLQFLVSLGEAYLFGGIAYAVVVRIHKGFHAFAGMALACFAAATLTQVYPRDTAVYFMLRFNPVDFGAKAGHWFVSGGTFLSVRGHELLFLAVWGIAVAVACRRQNRRFLAEDLAC